MKLSFKAIDKEQELEGKRQLRIDDSFLFYQVNRTQMRIKVQFKVTIL